MHILYKTGLMILY